MNAHIRVLKEVVADEVTTRVAAEAAAGRPLGLVDRSFEGIMSELMFYNWERNSHKTVDQIVREICFGIRKR